MPILFTFLSGCFGVTTGGVCGRDVAWYHCLHPIWLFDPPAAAGTVAVAGRPALAAAARLRGSQAPYGGLELIFLSRERSPAAARGLVDLPRAWESSALLRHLHRRVPRALGKVAVSCRCVGRSWFLELS